MTSMTAPMPVVQPRVYSARPLAIRDTNMLSLEDIQAIARQIASDHVRRASVKPKTFDYVLAVAGTLWCLFLVFSSVAAGWLTLWNTVLYKIGFFREILGLNRARQQAARQQVEREIQNLKKQLGR